MRLVIRAKSRRKVQGSIARWLAAFGKCLSCHLQNSYLPIDYRAVFSQLIAFQALAVAVVYDNQAETTVPNNIAMDENGFICRYDKDKKVDADLKYVEAGVLAGS